MLVGIADTGELGDEALAVAALADLERGGIAARRSSSYLLHTSFAAPVDLSGAQK